MDTTREIDARSVVTLITFIVVNILVIVPLPIPYPAPAFDDPTHRFKPTRWARKTFKLGLETAPVIGVLLLLASTCIPGSVVRDGIVGSGGVKPYDIMTLFLCFAYISLSLDSTGLLRYLAFLVGNKYSSSGSRLYAAFYSFFTITGLLIGNDPLILSGTPFLVYFTDHASIHPPTAFLHTHFQVSNLVSALLVSSNPTNLVLTSAFGISFLSYSAWMALPTIASALILYPILRYAIFGSNDYIPLKLCPPHVQAKDALHDKWGGVFGAVLFLITIILLVGLSAGGQLEHEHWTGVWIVVLPAAVAMALWDCVGDLRDPGRKERAKAVEEKGFGEVDRPAGGGVEMGRMAEKQVDDSTAGTPPSDGDGVQGRTETLAANSGTEKTITTQNTVAEGKTNTIHEEPSPDEHRSSADTAVANGQDTNPVITSGGHSTSREIVNTSDTPPENGNDSLSQPQASSEPRPQAQHSAPHAFSIFSIPPFSYYAKTFPTSTDVLRRMPWNLVPFAFSMFILVEALQYTGWIRVFGGWWAAWVRADSTGVAGVVWLMGVLSVLGCNVFGTNIGATILLSRVLQYWQQTSGPVSDRTLYGAVFALAVGSNFGAYSFVFSASLAGLLWRTILRQKGRTVTQAEFLRLNWLPVLVTMIVGCLIVAGEVCVMYQS